MTGRLPPDLAARLVVAQTKAERRYARVCKRWPRATKARECLIDFRIRPEVVAFGYIACDLASRGEILATDIATEVEEHLERLTRDLWPNYPYEVREAERVLWDVRTRMHASAAWRRYRRAVRRTAERLIAASSPPEAAQDVHSASTASAPPDVRLAEPPATMNDAAASLTWNDIELRFLSDRSVQCVVQGQRREPTNYAEMGFADRRGGDTPRLAWNTLVTFAESAGIIESTPMAHDWPKLEKRVQEIRRLLKERFGISEDPIPYQHGAYRARVRLTLTAAYTDR
jgi:hypothetical protein